MLSYSTVGTNDTGKALAFHDAPMGEIGVKRLFDHPKGAVYGESKPMFGVLRPFDGRPATVAVDR